jgi:hypothetical protein
MHADRIILSHIFCFGLLCSILTFSQSALANTCSTGVTSGMFTYPEDTLPVQECDSGCTVEYSGQVYPVAIINEGLPNEAFSYENVTVEQTGVECGASGDPDPDGNGSDQYADYIEQLNNPSSSEPIVSTFDDFEQADNFWRTESFGCSQYIGDDVLYDNCLMMENAASLSGFHSREVVNATESTNNILNDKRDLAINAEIARNRLIEVAEISSSQDYTNTSVNINSYSELLTMNNSLDDMSESLDSIASADNASDNSDLVPVLNSILYNGYAREDLLSQINDNTMSESSGSDDSAPVIIGYDGDATCYSDGICSNFDTGVFYVGVPDTSGDICYDDGWCETPSGMWYEPLVDEVIEPDTGSETLNEQFADNPEGDAGLGDSLDILGSDDDVQSDVDANVIERMVSATDYTEQFSDIFSLDTSGAQCPAFDVGTISIAGSTLISGSFTTHCGIASGLREILRAAMMIAASLGAVRTVMEA